MEKIFKIVTCGDVDSGKSTLFGRLLFNTGNIYKDQMEDIVRASQKYSTFDRIEYGYLFDGLLAERQQQITIDNAHRFFNIGNVRFHLIDCPGHKQYIRNFIVGCAEADCAVLVVDATKGIQDQTKRHYYYCKLLNVRHVVFVVTKIDLVDPDRVRLLEEELCSTFDTREVLITSAMENRHLEMLEHKLTNLARNVGQRDNGYECLQNDKRCAEPRRDCGDDRNGCRDTRNADQWALFVQDNILTAGNRAVTGIEMGTCDPAREVRVFPSGMPCRMSNAPCHTFTCDRNVDIARGSVITNASVHMGSELNGHLVPFVDAMPAVLLFKIGTDTAYVKSVGADTLSLRKEVVWADIASLKQLGYGILIDNATKLTVGMFLIKERETLGHKGKRCYWFTGLHGTGKTTLAKAFINTFVLPPILLDGDEVRGGINSDLTLEREGRDENVRRIAETAKLLISQGHDVCVSCISKEREQREAARRILGSAYVEIFVCSSDSTRKARDTKGLYNSGADILDGYEQSRYEVITISTDNALVDESLNELTKKLEENGRAS